MHELVIYDFLWRHYRSEIAIAKQKEKTRSNMTFPFYAQPDSKDCGPACLRMIAKYYGRNISLQRLRTLAETTREGSSLLSISDYAEKIGFRTLGVKINFAKLQEEAPLRFLG